MRLNKLWKFLSSMKFGMILLGVLALACVLGSVIPQGHDLDWYLEAYSSRTAALIFGLRLDDVFHSTWFLVLTVILLCNLMLCNLLHLPALLLRWKNAADPEKVRSAAPTVTVEGVADPQPVFVRLRMTTNAGEEGFLYAVKNRAGLWGAWICHLGILLLILGFTLGQSLKTEYTVYGVPGQTKPVGETGLSLTIEDFTAEQTESGMPSQYTAVVRLQDGSGADSGPVTVSVNNPAFAFGWKIFQNSTGSAAKLTILRDGDLLQEEYVCKGDYLVIQDTPVAVFFDGYDPEAAFDDGQTRPVYDYSLYDMSTGTLSESRYQLEGETAIQTSVYEVRFSDARDFTLLQLKQEPYSWLALIGGLVILLGLILAFYLQPKTVWAERQEDGTWTISGACRKGGPLFAEQLREAAKLPEHQEA